MSFLSLPNELLLEVITSLSARDLHSLILVNHRLYGLLIPELNNFALESDQDYITALYLAAVSGNERTIRQLLNKKLPIIADKRFCVGATADEIATYLLKWGHRSVILDPSFRSTALHWAIEIGHQSMIASLLKKGISVSVRDRTGQTPLMCAARSGLEDACRLLLEAGAKPNVGDYNTGMSVLYRAVNIGNKEIVKMLLDNGAHISMGSRNRCDTPLYKAVHNNDFMITKILIEYGADVRTNGVPYPYPIDPLIVAIEHSNTEIIRLFLAGNVDCLHYSGETTLQYAASINDPAIVETLLDMGADIEYTGRGICTALYHACAHGSVEVLRVLLDRGANINALCVTKRTGLHWAIKNRQSLQCVSLLLERGIDTNALYIENRAALYCITYTSNGYHEVAS